MVFNSAAAASFAAFMLFTRLTCASLDTLCRVVLTGDATDADASAVLVSELFTIVRGMVTMRSLQMRTVLLTMRSKHVEERRTSVSMNAGGHCRTCTGGAAHDDIAIAFQL